MRRNGEIIIIEDDEDDRLLLKDIFESLNYANKITFIEDLMDALKYLVNPLVTPFIIFSDINMSKLNGFELREQILADPVISSECVPYIFLSTSKIPENVIKAYTCHVQGYFKKEDDFSKFRSVISMILEYWYTSLTPTSYL